MLQRLGVLVASGLAAALAGCATSDFRPAIEEFARATVGVEATYNAGQAQIDTILLAEGLADAMAGRDVVALDGDCTFDAARCRLILGDGGPFTAGAFEHNVQLLMSELSAYATGLRAIAAAASGAEVQASVSRIKAQLDGLAGNVDTLAGRTPGAPGSTKARFAEIAGPLGNLAAFAVERRIEGVKIAALRDSTAAMEVVIDDMVLVLDAQAEALRTVQVARLNRAFESAYDAYLGAPTNRQTLEALRVAANALDAGLQRPRTLFTGIAEAHQALYNALRLRELDFDELWPILQRVFHETDRLAAIVEQITVL
ncbi:MAG: hypothetical protein AB7O56_09050 [Bauldia sp.]